MLQRLWLADLDPAEARGRSRPGQPDPGRRAEAT